MRERHGRRHTKEYEIWKSMKQRCKNPRNKSYKNYGGRGISVCDEWEKSFAVFFRDMGKMPSGFSLERIDNSKGYYPENCTWASTEAQAQNKRNTVNVVYLGVAMSVSKAARLTGFPRRTLSRRLKKGMTIEEATRTPRKRCRTLLVDVNGDIMSVCSAAKLLHMPRSTLLKRYHEDRLLDLGVSKA